MKRLGGVIAATALALVSIGVASASAASLSISSSASTLTGAAVTITVSGHADQAGSYGVFAQRSTVACGSTQNNENGGNSGRPLGDVIAQLVVCATGTHLAGDACVADAPPPPPPPKQKRCKSGFKRHGTRCVRKRTNRKKP